MEKLLNLFLENKKGNLFGKIEVLDLPPASAASTRG
jgi:hypothetical protein